ncbi:ABC transporter permease [Paracoccus denitrificans]|uniref:ABC transporter permease n=1 Tax=Paracoccus denitrificans TaxID=266 RepID=UPI000CEBF227|nr:ABC transporter permease [Paracoccus denitrificans]
MAALTGWWDDFFFGTLTVLKVFTASLILAVIFGLIGSSAKLSGSRVAQFMAKAYTVVFRGTPELVVLLLFYFGMAVVLTSIAQLYDPQIKFIDIPPFWAGSVAIGLVVGAYMTETFRGAFLGVPHGQIEAAGSLGLSKAHTFFYVRLPQMWRLALPNFGNHMLSVMKDTALISIIGLEEVVFVAEMATAVNHQPFFMFMFVAMIYLAITTIITFAVSWLERYANRHLEGAR